MSEKTARAKLYDISKALTVSLGPVFAGMAQPSRSAETIAHDFVKGGFSQLGIEAMQGAHKDQIDPSALTGIKTKPTGKSTRKNAKHLINKRAPDDRTK